MPNLPQPMSNAELAKLRDAAAAKGGVMLTEAEALAARGAVLAAAVQTEAAAIAQKCGLKALEPFISRMIDLEKTVQRLEVLLKYHGLI